MIRRSRALRLALAVLALVQVGLPPVAAYADAQVHRVEVAATGTRLARTPQGPTRTAGSHECPLCTFLSHVAVSPDVSVGAPLAAELQAQAVPSQGPPRTFLAWRLPHSRAPPLT